MGYVYTCETQYVNIRLVVYDEKKGLALETFSVAAGCACTYKLEDFWEMVFYKLIYIVCLLLDWCTAVIIYCNLFIYLFCWCIRKS